MKAKKKLSGFGRPRERLRGRLLLQELPGECRQRVGAQRHLGRSLGDDLLRERRRCVDLATGGSQHREVDQSGPSDAAVAHAGAVGVRCTEQGDTLVGLSELRQRESEVDRHARGKVEVHRLGHVQGLAQHGRRDRVRARGGGGQRGARGHAGPRCARGALAR
ncbi:hypothetical protein [Chondromyces apiculatus]|uniref:hypothetical protein n=1 Tax=Chondromyces apiculatus TaxID=51 RepID=UPI0018CC46AA|nr:hypothetical protein [Chondromyces apiculatus]